MEKLTKDEWHSLDDVKRSEMITQWMKSNNVKREKIPRYELGNGGWKRRTGDYEAVKAKARGVSSL